MNLPILIIIPHGGYRVPEELSGYENVNEFDLFLSADTCAREIFDFRESASAVVDSAVSRLFIDTDRHFEQLPPGDPDGVIKTVTTFRKNIFKTGFMPDSTAVANLLRRYYHSFHESIEKALSKKNIRLILDCHTVLAAAPASSPDAGSPRPVVRLDNIITSGNSQVKTCDDGFMKLLHETIKKNFSGEKESAGNAFETGSGPVKGYIAEQYGATDIPLVRISLSRALFLNETYFSYDYLRVDDIRIRSIRQNLWKSIEKAWKKYY